MQQEYTISDGMRLFYVLSAFGMIIFAMYLLSIYNPTVTVAVLLFPLGLAGGAVLILINVFKRKVIIDEERIRCINLFSTREMALSDIKGSRVGQKSIELEPTSPTVRKISIGNYNDLENSDELANWARDNFKDLVPIDLEIEKSTALQDPKLGLTESDREDLLKRKKTVAIVYNIAGLFLGFCMIFFPTLLAACIGLFYPLLGVLLMVFSKGATKYVVNLNRSVYSYILLGFVLPCFTLLIMSLDKYSVVKVSALWLPGFGVAAILFLLLYATGINRSIGSIRVQLIFMAIPALLYGYGAVRMANCVFDPSVPKIYSVGVQDRRVDHGKSVSYYLLLSPWGPRQEDQEVEVGRSVYRSVRIGDTVKVNVKGGLFHIAWFTVNR
jgi:hypothetical protein